LAQPATQTQVPVKQNEGQTHTPDRTVSQTPENKVETGTTRLMKMKIGQLGPSIKAVSSAPTEPLVERKSTPSVEDKQFSQEDITYQWHSYVERMPIERQAMKMRMKGMTPKLIDANTFEIVANNTQIGQYLLNMQDSILDTMRKALCNRNIKMSVRIAQAYEVQHITSKPALYQKMVEKNSNIKRLADLLKLEICM
jgi:hypothetical protein